MANIEQAGHAPRHLSDILKPLAIATVGALGLTGIVAGAITLLSQDRGPQNPPAEPVKASDPFKPAEPASAGIPAGTKLAEAEFTSTPVPTVTEIPATATPEPSPTREIKPIPDVITLASLEQAGRGIIVKSPEWIEAARAEAVQKGEIKFPLPKIIFDLGGKVHSTARKDGLLITDVDPNQQPELPALVKGTTIKAGPANKRANVIIIRSKIDGYEYNLTFPLNGSKILIQSGDPVEPNQSVCKTQYESTFQQSFPLEIIPNKFAAISISNPDGSLAKIDQSNILTDENGNIVVVDSSPLVAELNVDVNPDLVAYMVKGSPVTPSS